MTNLNKQVPAPPSNSIPTAGGLICGTHRIRLKLVGEKEVRWVCPECARERTQKWRDAHRGEPEYKSNAITKQRAYYGANRDRILEQKKATYVGRPARLPFPQRMADCHPDRVHCAKGLCKPCYDALFRKANRERHNAACSEWSQRNPNYKSGIHRQARYGVTPEECREMFERQGGLCAICRTGPAEHLDHDHITKRNRALLCGNCNRGLGCFKDNPDFLMSAILYLSKGTLQ